MPESKISSLKNRMQPTFQSILDCHYEGDFKAISKIYPSLPSDVFEQAGRILNPLGKSTMVEFLGTINKVSEIKLLWKVSYQNSPEELLWDLSVEANSDEPKLVGIGFDK